MRFFVGVMALLLGCGDSGGGSESSTTGAATTASTGSDPSTADDGPTSASTTGSTSASADTTSAAEETSTGDDGGTSTTGGSRTCAGTFAEPWPNGLDCGESEIFVHQYDENTVILRQSLCTSFEGPFLFLLFGQDRVLLEDTGAGGIEIADAVDGIIDQWLAANQRESIDLVVVNSHAHGDHTAGNSMFTGLPNTTVVPPTVAGLSEYFGIAEWPNDVVQFDLGGRTIDVIPIPGHQQSHIALFDHGAGLLLTGDTLYPGRLYIDDFDAYVASIHRLVDTVPAADVCHVLGTHIEMTQTPGVDFEFGATEHPNEHVLELTWDHLLELRDAVDAMDTPQIEVHDDFIVYPL
jgi:hydroxyacylglutathione hydrolase